MSTSDGSELEAAAVDDAAQEEYDFDTHRTTAIELYRRLRPTYSDLAQTVGNLLEKSLAAININVHSIEKRAKDLDSFGRKAATALDEDPAKPKYVEPLTQITDLAGCRVITFFLKNVEEVDKVIESQFHVEEKLNRSAFLRGEQRLGYESMHYIVRLNDDRLQWPEYAPFKGLRAEIQVRTILQHAWAEIEHDIQYKSVDVLPSSIRRRFLALAGMIEVGDREFQAIADAHEDLRIRARQSIDEGRLEGVEITPDSLRAYLDRKFGQDLRMRDWSYAWDTKLLKNLGFSNLAQLDECLAGYNPDRISRVIHTWRQGQLTRLEDTLLASMGENYVRRHLWADDEEMQEWFIPGLRSKLDRLRAAGIDIGSYLPKPTP